FSGLGRLGAEQKPRLKQQEQSSRTASQNAECAGCCQEQSAAVPAEPRRDPFPSGGWYSREAVRGGQHAIHRHSGIAGLLVGERAERGDRCCNLAWSLVAITRIFGQHLVQYRRQAGRQTEAHLLNGRRFGLLMPHQFLRNRAAAERRLAGQQKIESTTEAVDI